MNQSSSLPAGIPEQLEGWTPVIDSPAMLEAVVECAFNYRGDVTLISRSGRTFEGYVFDRQKAADLSASKCRMILAGTGDRVAIPFAEIQSIAFTGRDPATGKSFQTWVEKYLAKKAAGEKNIGIEPQPLD